jgi:hypothetical protein
MFTTTQIIITIIASVSSGLVGVLFNYKKEKKKEQIRQAEKMHDGLLLELKDLDRSLSHIDHMDMHISMDIEHE